MEIVDAIKPRPDIKDYYGNLPLYYSLLKNDVDMVKYLFKKGKDYCPDCAKALFKIKEQA